MDSTQINLVGWTITITIALAGVIFTLIQFILKKMDARMSGNELNSDTRYHQLLQEITNTNKHLASTNENLAQMSSSIKYIIEREIPTMQKNLKDLRYETGQQISDIHRRLNHEVMPSLTRMERITSLPYYERDEQRNYRRYQDVRNND